jgi:zinc transport system substrate-binding protein
MILITVILADMQSSRYIWSLFVVGSVVGLTALSATACSDTEATTASKSVTIAASFYPIEEIVSNLSVESVNIVGLTPPGAGAHDLELTSEQLADLEDSDVLFYLGDGFQPGIEKVMTSLPKSVQVVDLLERITVRDIVPQLEGLEGETDGESLESGKDPHVWLDPANMIIMANHVHDVLQDIQGIDKKSLDSSLNTYVADLTKLGSEFDDGLKQCESNVIVTSHRAFEYLAARTNPIQNLQQNRCRKSPNLLWQIRSQQSSLRHFFPKILRGQSPMKSAPRPTCLTQLKVSAKTTLTLA